MRCAMKVLAVLGVRRRARGGSRHGSGAVPVDHRSARRARRRAWTTRPCVRKGLDLLAHLNKPPGCFDPANPGTFAFPNSDMAFQGNYAFVGNFNGFNIYDISNPATPAAQDRASGAPGSQNDVSVYKQPAVHVGRVRRRAKRDCTRRTRPSGGDRRRRASAASASSTSRTSERRSASRSAAFQTCRGSHTHTLVTPKSDPDNVYIYVSGTSASSAGDRRRSPDCNCNNATAADPNPSQWRIEVIKVPLADPSAAAVVNEPRLFARRGDRPRRRPAERAADAEPSVRPGLGPGAGHRLLPRHHGLRGARPRRRRLRGQRHPRSTSPTRPTRSASTPSPTRCSPTGTARRSPTTARPSCSRTSGAAATPRAAARPTS